MGYYLWDWIRIEFEIGDQKKKIRKAYRKLSQRKSNFFFASATSKRTKKKIDSIRLSCDVFNLRFYRRFDARQKIHNFQESKESKEWKKIE